PNTSDRPGISHPDTKLDKATAQNLSGHAPAVHPVPALQGASAPSRDAFAFQRALGNQAMLQLLGSGGLQANLRVSQPGGAAEQEADRVAEQIVSTQAGPRLQRKCACGGSCAQCQEEQASVIHRRARTAPTLRSFPFSIQRQAAATDEGSHRAAAA